MYLTRTPLFPHVGITNQVELSVFHPKAFLSSNVHNSFFSVFIIAASVNCYNYLVLNTADRSMNYSATADKCDDTLDFNRWYRIAGAAGTQIPENEVPYRRCGARYPGWMDGVHPSVKDGVVTRHICFVLGKDRCRWLSKIKVQNCGGFFVYKLAAPSYCNQRYCGYHGKGFQSCSLT